MRLGRDASPTFAGITFSGLTASTLIGINASKALESITVGIGLDYTRPDLTLSHLGIEALTDPGADKILFWDDSASACKWLGVGNSVAITDVTIDTIQDIRTTASPTFAGLTMGGAATRTINRDGTDKSLVLAGATGQSDGAYFNITGITYSASPGLGSAEFVIRDEAGGTAAERSKFVIYAYDGASSWKTRFKIYGDTGEIQTSGGAVTSGGVHSSLVIAGGHASTYGTRGAYFTITGNTHSASPGLGSAEFIIRENAGANWNERSKFALYSYDGSSWDIRFILLGNTGYTGFGVAEPETFVEMRDYAPYLTLRNDTHEDGDGGRESRINFKGEQSGGEDSTLARIEVGHEGTDDDEKAFWKLFVNDGNDGDSPTQVLEIGSNLLATFAGAVASATLTITASADDTNVSGVNTLFVNTTSGNVTLGGLVGGVDGQVLYIVKIVAVNDLILEHEEGIGGDTDDFFMHQISDETIDSGGVVVVYNGTTEKWYDVSHAKHV